MGSATAQLAGNIASEPRQSLDNPGHERVSFRLIANERKPDGAGGWMDGDPFAITVVCWGALAKNAAKSLNKGEPLIVSGRLVQRQYELDGETKYATELKANQIGHDLSRGFSVFTKAGPARDSATVRDVDEPDEIDAFDDELLGVGG